MWIAFLIGMVACAIYGWVKGDPRKLILGWDSDQNGCGFSDNTSDYKYLYWPETPDTAMIQQIDEGNTDNVV